MKNKQKTIEVTGHISHQSEPYANGSVTWDVSLDKPLQEGRASKRECKFNGVPNLARDEVLGHRVSMRLRWSEGDPNRGESGCWIYEDGYMRVIPEVVTAPERSPALSVLLPSLNLLEKPGKDILDVLWKLTGYDRYAVRTYIQNHMDFPDEVRTRLKGSYQTSLLDQAWSKMRENCKFGSAEDWFLFHCPSVEDRKLYVANDNWLTRNPSQALYNQRHGSLVKRLRKMEQEQLLSELTEWLGKELKRNPYDLLIHTLGLPVRVADWIVLKDLNGDREDPVRYAVLLRYAYQRVIEEKHGMFLNCVDSVRVGLDGQLSNMLFCLFDELETFPETYRKKYGCEHRVNFPGTTSDSKFPARYAHMVPYSRFSTLKEWFDYVGFDKPASFLLKKAGLLVDAESKNLHLYTIPDYENLQYLRNVMREKKELFESADWTKRADSRFRKRLAYQAFSQMTDKNGQKIHPTQGQELAFDLFRRYNFVHVLGGPGTGKTAFVKEVCRFWLKNVSNPDILMMAPTGVAAQNLKTNLSGDTEDLNFYGNRAMTVEYWLTRTQDLPAGYTFHWTDSKRKVPLTRRTLIIVDEISMLTIGTMVRLFRRIGNMVDGPTVLLIGDHDQLPPIGEDPYLNELYRYICTPEGRWVPCAILNENKRQTKAGSLLDWVIGLPTWHRWQCQYLEKLAQKSSVPSPGQSPADQFLNAYRDFQLKRDAKGHFLFTRKSLQLYELPEVCSENQGMKAADEQIEQFVYEYIDHVCGSQDVMEAFQQFLILVPYNGSPSIAVGKTKVLNELIRTYVNKKMQPKHQNQASHPHWDSSFRNALYYEAPASLSDSVYSEDMKFRLGDRVLNTKNRPRQELLNSNQCGIYNGDLGFITRYYPKDAANNSKKQGLKEARWVVSFDDGRQVMVRNDELHEWFTYGYALTVHKSQGCEAKHVLMIVPHHNAQTWRTFITFNLLFTGCTRAKESLTVVYDKDNWLSGFAKRYEPERVEFCEILQRDSVKEEEVEDGD